MLMLKCKGNVGFASCFQPTVQFIVPIKVYGSQTSSSCCILMGLLDLLRQNFFIFLKSNQRQNCLLTLLNKKVKIYIHIFKNSIVNK